MPVTWLELNPLDTLALRDGRPFDAGTDTIASAVDLLPSTVTGAIWASLYGKGHDYDRSLKVCAPLLARTGASGLTPLFPWPRDVLRGDDGTARRLQAGAPTARVVGPAVTPLVLDGEGEIPANEMFPADALQGYLNGQTIHPGFAGEPDPRTHEFHLGLARDGRTAKDGMLYGADHVRLASGSLYLARVHSERSAPTPQNMTSRLGGESRICQLRVLPTPIALPTSPDSFPGGRLAMYLATPAIWPDGWRPPLPGGAELMAAAVDGPVPIASWGRDRGRNHATRFQLRWGVPAGSVYYFKFARESDASAFARRSHDRCYEQAEGRLRTAGFGWSFMGKWNDV